MTDPALFETHPESSGPTRDRILDAAELLFADKGFVETSVRDITASAGVNLAAMNYHFGGKDSLYQEVVLRRLKLMRDERIAAIRRVMTPTKGKAKLEVLLRSFADAVMAPVLDGGRGSIVVKLLTREMTETRLPEGLCQAEVMAPVDAELTRAIRALVPELEEHEALMAVHGVQSQLFGMFQVARCQGTLDEGQAYGVTFPQAIDHIVRFSAAGIRGLAAS